MTSPDATAASWWPVRGIDYRDFRPPILEHGGLLTLPIFGSIGRAVAAANEWIGESRVEVVNVETLLLPDLSLTDESATPDSGSFVARENACLCQVVRVWFRTPGAPA